MSNIAQASALLKKQLSNENVDSHKARRTSKLFIDSLKSGNGVDFKSYESFATSVYGESKPPIGTLWSAASRYINGTLDEIAILDLKPTLRNHYDKVRYETQRNILVADLFYVKGMSVTSMHLWKKTLKMAKKHGLTFEACHCAMRLCYQYAFRLRKADHYNLTRMLRTLLTHAKAEAEAARHYQSVVMLMKDKWFFPSSFRRISSKALARTYALARKYKTHELWLAAFRVRIYHDYIIQNYSDLLKTCRHYRNFLILYPHLQQDSRWADIAIHEMNACITLRKFGYGIRCAEQNIKYMKPENSNWLTYQENLFQLLMHAKEYERAKSLFENVMQSNWKKKMSPYQQDVWQIYQSYLHLALNDVHQIGLFTPVRYYTKLKRIKSDKAGLNFLIHAGLTIYLIAQQNTADLDEFADNFRKYISRHIDRRKHFRTYYFSLLLLLLYKYRFNADKVKSIGEKFFEKLKNYSLGSRHDKEIAELIPYDHLWPIILRLLQNNELSVQ